jgi:hypothetical protein
LTPHPAKKKNNLIINKELKKNMQQRWSAVSAPEKCGRARS